MDLYMYTSRLKNKGFAIDVQLILISSASHLNKKKYLRVDSRCSQRQYKLRLYGLRSTSNL